MLKMSDLELCFKKAKEKGVAYVGIKIQDEGYERPEIVINELEDFEKKLKYYKECYNEDLNSKNFNGIKIIGISYADSLGYIENELLW